MRIKVRKNQTGFHYSFSVVGFSWEVDSDDFGETLLEDIQKVNACYSPSTEFEDHHYLSFGEWYLWIDNTGSFFFGNPDRTVKVYLPRRDVHLILATLIKNESKCRGGATATSVEA